MKEEKTNAIQIAQSTPKKMNVESFNVINEKIDEITKILADYEGVKIDTSIKGLKSVGMSVSEHFYRIGQEDNSDE